MQRCRSTRVAPSFLRVGQLELFGRRVRSLSRSSQDQLARVGSYVGEAFREVVGGEMLLFSLGLPRGSGEIRSATLDGAPVECRAAGRVATPPARVPSTASSPR